MDELIKGFCSGGGRAAPAWVSVRDQRPPVELVDEPARPGPGCGGERVRHIYCRGCGYKLARPVSCGDRLCPACRKLEHRRLWAKYLPLIRQVPASRLAFVTLTLRIEPGQGEQAYLARQVARLRKQWSALIRRKAWQDAVVGGMVAFEVKWSRGLKSWNAHLHALVEARGTVRTWRAADGKLRADLDYHGGSLSPQGLSGLWSELSAGTSFICDIRPTRGAADAVFWELTKYVKKAPRLPADQGLEQAYNAALSGRRLVSTFGTWSQSHKACRFERRVKPTAPDCPVCGCTSWMGEWELGHYAWRAKWSQAPPAAA